MVRRTCAQFAYLDSQLISQIRFDDMVRGRYTYKFYFLDDRLYLELGGGIMKKKMNINLIQELVVRAILLVVFWWVKL